MYENTSFSRNFLFPFSYWGERYHVHFEFLDFSRIRKVWNLWLYPGTERNTAYKTKKKNWKTLLCAVSGRNCCKRSRSKGIFMFQSEYFPISIYSDNSKDKRPFLRKTPKSNPSSDSERNLVEISFLLPYKWWLPKHEYEIKGKTNLNDDKANIPYLLRIESI